MKPATAKATGRETENALVEWLHKNGYPYAERRRLNGILDRGDISGVIGVTIEVKRAGGTRVDLSGHMRELRVEMVNDNADYGLVAIRPRGKPDPEDWWALMPLPQAFYLIEGLGRPLAAG